jgi:hypothetical protein
LGLVADKIGDINSNFANMIGNIDAFKEINKKISYKESKDLIYKEVFLPKLKEFEEELELFQGYNNLEITFDLIEKEENRYNSGTRYAIKINNELNLFTNNSAGNPEKNQQVKSKLEDLLRFCYNEFPDSGFCINFKELGEYSVNLGLLLNILKS